MKKNEYLAEAREFIRWMARHLHADSALGHQYRRPSRVEPVTFANLADALAKYEWPIAAAVRGAVSGDTLAANTEVLDRLADALRQAKTDEAARDACIAVMQWGGVVNGNVPWLTRHTMGLATLLTDVKERLAGDDDDGVPLDVRFNAGMTKVYSLLLGGFIIYDSRVAAALCWFVLHWAREKGLAEVPPMLRFPCMPAKEGDAPAIRKVRNPSSGSLRFPQMHNRARRHAQWNMRASWLLEAVLADAGGNTVFHQSAQPLRMLEAALFMWGYDLGQNMPASNEIAADAALDEEGPDDEPMAADYPMRTLGRNNPFHWYFDENGDRVVLGSTPQYRLSTLQLFTYLHALHDVFATDDIPLANNRDYVHDPESPDGMGTILSRTLDKSPMVASRLAAVLVSIGQLGWNGQSRDIACRFDAPPPADVDTLRNRLCGHGL